MFICFEGIAGAGKTTQANLLKDYLQEAKGVEVFLSSVYEGGFRKIISDFMKTSLIGSDENATMFLFQSLHAAQRCNVEKALCSGKVVVADSWRHPFFAYHLYQNTFSGNRKIMNEIDRLGHGVLEPDICFLPDLPVELAYSRYIKREEIINDKGLKIMGMDYFFSAQKYYKDVAQKKCWKIIDFSTDPQSVFEKVAEEIDKIL